MLKIGSEFGAFPKTHRVNIITGHHLQTIRKVLDELAACDDVLDYDCVYETASTAYKYLAPVGEKGIEDCLALLWEHTANLVRGDRSDARLAAREMAKAIPLGNSKYWPLATIESVVRSASMVFTAEPGDAVLLSCPEAHLPGEAIGPLMRWLYNRAEERDVVLFIWTHSKHVIGALAPTIHGKYDVGALRCAGHPRGEYISGEDPRFSCLT